MMRKIIEEVERKQKEYLSKMSVGELVEIVAEHRRQLRAHNLGSVDNLMKCINEACVDAELMCLAEVFGTSDEDIYDTDFSGLVRVVKMKNEKLLRENAVLKKGKLSLTGVQVEELMKMAEYHRDMCEMQSEMDRNGKSFQHRPWADLCDHILDELSKGYSI